MTGVYGVLIGMGLVIVLLAAVVIGLLKSNAEVLRRLDRLGVRLEDDPSSGPHQPSPIEFSPRRDRGAPVPPISGIVPDGEPVVASPMAGHDPVLLAFLSTSCSSCTGFWENLSDSTKRIGERQHRVIIVTLGPEEESPTRASSLRRGDAQVIMSSSSWDDYQVPGAPYFVLVDPTSGIVGEGSVSTYDSLAGFLDDTANDREWDRRNRVGDRTDRDREDRINDELTNAGFLPDDPRFYELESSEETGVRDAD